jgi:hypothetical protein
MPEKDYCSSWAILGSLGSGSGHIGVRVRISARVRMAVGEFFAQKNRIWVGASPHLGRCQSWACLVPEGHPGSKPLH